MASDKWTADPARGAEFVEPRRQEIVGKLQEAADVAFYTIDQQLAVEIEAARKRAGDKKATIMRSIEDAQRKPAMEIVRKYWNADPELMWMNAFHNMTEGSGKP